MTTKGLRGAEEAPSPSNPHRSDAGYSDEEEEWRNSLVLAQGKLEGLLRTLGMPTPSSGLAGGSPARSPRAPVVVAEVDDHLEARVASQSAAITALRRTVTSREREITSLEGQVARLRVEVKAKEAAILAAERSASSTPDATQLQREHQQVIASTVESFERKIKDLKDKAAQQSKRSQQLLEKIRKASSEKELAESQKREAEEGKKRAIEQQEQLKVRLKIYKDRYKEELQKNAQSQRELERLQSRIAKAVQSDKESQEKVSAIAKELSTAKSALSKETTQRKKSHHEAASLRGQNQELASNFQKFRARFEKHEEQREKMVQVIKHLKHINKELMSVLLEERAANERHLSMEDMDHPSLLPQALRLAKEDKAALGKRPKTEEDVKVTAEGGQKPPPLAKSRGAQVARDDDDVAFYKSLKDRYQEAKATYRSLLAKEM